MNNILRNSVSTKAKMTIEHHPRGHVYTSKISIDFVNNETGHDVTSNQETKRNQETVPSARRWAVAAMGSEQDGGESRLSSEDGADDELMEVDANIERRRSKRVSALISQFNSITKVAPERASSFRSVPPKLIRLSPSGQDSNLQRSQSLSTKSPALSAFPDNKLLSHRQNIKTESGETIIHKQNIPAESADKIIQKQNVHSESADKITQKQNVHSESADKITQKQNVHSESADKITQKQNVHSESADKITQKQNVHSESADNKRLSLKRNITTESTDHKVLRQNELSKTADNKNIYEQSVPTKIVDNKHTHIQNVSTGSTDKFTCKQNVPIKPTDGIQDKLQTAGNRTPQSSDNSKANKMSIQSRDMIQENVSSTNNLGLSFDDNVFDSSPASHYDIVKVKPAVKKHMNTEWARLRSGLNTDYTRTQSESNTQGGPSEADTSFSGTRLSLPRNLNPKDVFAKENVKDASPKESPSTSAGTARQHSVDTAGHHSVDTIGQNSVDTVGQNSVDTVGQNSVDTVGQNSVDTVGQNSVDTVRQHLMDTSDIAQTSLTDIQKTLENNGPQDSLPEKSSSKNIQVNTPTSVCLPDSRVTLTSNVSSDQNITPYTEKEKSIPHTGKEKSIPYSDREESISYTNNEKNIPSLDKVCVPPIDLDLSKNSDRSPGEVSACDVTSSQPAGTPVEEKKSVTFALMPDLEGYTAGHGQYSDPHAKSKGTIADRAREIIQSKGRETLKDKNSSDVKVYVMCQDNNKLTMSECVDSVSTTRQCVDTPSTPVATHTADYCIATDRISNALNTLKTELVAMREQDLVLLKQLINISNTIQKIHRSRVLKVSKSLSFSSSYLHPPPLHPSKRCYSTTLDRQNSASYVMDRRRNMYSYMRSSTESSLSSFDESELDSASEFDESTTSLNSTFTNLSPELTRARLRYQIRAPEVSLCLNVAEDGELTYEDILRRNVKLWKLSSSGR